MKVVGYVIEKTPTSGSHIGEPVKILKGGKEVSMESGYLPEELFNSPQGAQMVVRTNDDPVPDSERLRRRRGRGDGVRRGGGSGGLSDHDRL